MRSTRKLLLLAGLAAAWLYGTSPVWAGPIITGYEAQAEGGGSVAFTITFDQAVVGASAHSANSLFGYIDIDKDQNSATGGNAPWGNQNVAGGNSWINFFAAHGFGNTVALGDEYYVSFVSEAMHAGSVDVFDTLHNQSVGTVAIHFSGNTVTLDLSTALLGGGSDIYNYGIIAGFVNAPSTEVGPATVTPEPSSLVLCGFGAVSLAAYGWRRRKAAHA
jgi:hypothetical protein